MTVKELRHFETSPPAIHHTASHPLLGRYRSEPVLKERLLSSAPSDADWVSPFTLPPLPSLRRNRDPVDSFKSPESFRQRDSSGAYYAAAWGSPYATPSPRRTPQGPDSIIQRLNLERTPLPDPGRSAAFSNPGDGADSAGSRTRHCLYRSVDQSNPWEASKPLRSEKSVWLSDSEDGGSEIGQKEGKSTPTRPAYTGSWGASPTDSVIRSPVKHRRTESLVTVTQDTFHVSGSLPVASRRQRVSVPSVEHIKMAGQEPEDEHVASPKKPLPALPRKMSQVDDDEMLLVSPKSAVRPHPMSMQSYQRPKKKVVWKGKACIIALPLTDREAAGLPPLLRTEEIRERIDMWMAAGYTMEGFRLTDQRSENSVASNGQSRPVHPDPIAINAERKLRNFQVHIHNPAEWQSWVDQLKEEKLRALGVSPSSSEAPASTRSPFSANMSRVSSAAYPGLAASPPIAPSSSASNPLRATSNPFSPSLMSSSGFSPQPGSVTSSQFNGSAKQMHGYKPSVSNPGFHQGRVSPYEPVMPQQAAFSNGARPNVQALSSRQNSFSPNHSLQLPNMGEVLSQTLHMPAPSIQYGSEQAHPNPVQQRGHAHPQYASQDSISPALPPRPDSQLHTPQYSESSRTPIEIAHPTPKSHRQNLSIALQREIDEAEATLHAKHNSLHAETSDHFDPSSKRGSVLDESVNEEPPILRRPETRTSADDRSEIETNPSLAATPMLMYDDKNPFANWQALSDAARAVVKPASKAALPSSRFNVEAKEFDPRAGFSSSNFSFGGPESRPFGLASSNYAPAERPPAKNPHSTSYLNAGAPAFTPLLTSDPEVNPFSFSSASFNVAAPVFNPSQSPGTNFKTSLAPAAGDVPIPTNSIFGNVVIDPGSKVTRRASKPAPSFVSKSTEVEDDESDPTDDEGRPVAPIERQKRVRRHDSDGDRSPVFADSAPFQHRRILSEIVDAIDSDASEANSPVKPIDGWAYIPADESQLRVESSGVQKEAEGIKEADKRDSVFIFTDQDDAAMFNEARPPLDVDRSETEHEPASHEKLEDETELSSTYSEPLEVPDQHSRRSLSALAKPFEFNPRISRSLSSSKSGPAQKHKGLEASKYAEPSSQPARSMATISSPPRDLPHYAEKDHESVNDADDVVEVFEDDDSRSEDNVVEVIEENSTEGEGAASREIVETGKEPDVYLPAEEDNFDIPGPSLRHQDQPVPSFEEIDAVMKHLEENPELGVERNDAPIQSTPLIDMRLGGNFRSDAPSPSPRRPHDDKIAQNETSYPPSYGLGIGVHDLNPTRDDVSDWGDALASPEAAKVQHRSRFFDGHVNDLVDGILEIRLGPLEQTLQTIQHSLALLATNQKPQGNPKKERRSLSTEQKESDADDEDDYDAFEGFSNYRSRSPAARRGERKHDLLRAAIAEAMAAHQPAPQPQPSVDMTEVNAVLAEMKQLAHQTGTPNTQTELKTIVEDVISHHPRLRGSRVREDHETAEMKFKPQLDGLESMLKISQEHAAEEARLRRKGEEEINELKLRLRIAEEEAAQYRESSDEAQQTLEAFVEEKESYKGLERELDVLTLRNTALETTLEEYRVSSDQWREDIRNERSGNQDLKRTLQELHKQLEEQVQARDGMRAKIERIQSQMTQVIQDMHAEQEDLRNKEHAHVSKLAVTQDAFEQERRHRQKAELEVEALEKEHKANLHLKTDLERAHSDVSRLKDLAAALQEDNRVLDTKAFNLSRELDHTEDCKDAEIATSTAKLQLELESTLTKLANVLSDSNAHIARLQGRLDHAELDLQEQKAKYDTLFTEAIEAHQQALREAGEKKDNALEDQHQIHEKKLNELRERHTRELHNSFDTRTRLEHQTNERLSLDDDKIKHLESKVEDLEDRLAITKSAARAAVEAATAKGVNLPTPASSVVASPPQRAASASLSFARGTEIPEKISPQALRESIMVLQDQLQNREQKIEQLEAELSAVDKEAPGKVRDRDTEISWLRELLGVRIDDLEDLTNTLSKPDFNRESVRDAAIRLRANLQMEQQLRDRAGAGPAGSSLPTMSGLSSYAQSPRALPLAAAAAWGNWRKARDTSLGALSELATNLGSQTPSKATMGSPASFLSGMMSPPATSQKTPNSSEPPFHAPPTMRPLATAAAQARKSSGPEARPLRAFNSQPRALSSRQLDARPGSRYSAGSSRPSQLSLEPPRTPTQIKNHLDLTEDVDDDASSLGGKDTEQYREVREGEAVSMTE